MKVNSGSSAIARVFLVLLLPGCLIPLTPACHAAQGGEDQLTPNFAFATQLGSGIYDVDGRTIQIYRFAPSFWIRSLDNRRLGLRIRFPLTLGFYNFTITDVLGGEFPDRLNTAALVPSLEIPMILEDNWFLTAFGGLGWGKDLDTGTTTYIVATGASSLALFSFLGQDVRLGNRFVYSGYTDKEFTPQDDFSLLESAVDARRPVGIRLFRREVAASIFAVNYLYVVSPQLIRQVEETLRAKVNWEFGFTVGAMEPWRVLGLRIPRLGMGYRFGGDGSALRFIIGNPFPLDPPITRPADAAGNETRQEPR